MAGNRRPRGRAILLHSAPQLLASIRALPERRASAAAGQLPAFLPGQFAAGFLNSFSPGNMFDFAPFLLIGAWVAGSSWAGGTFKTALLQQPGRTQTSIAQALAVGITVATGPVLTFVLREPPARSSPSLTLRRCRRRAARSRRFPNLPAPSALPWSSLLPTQPSAGH